jgi:hypothetical protein
MKITITLTDDNGRIFTGTTTLSQGVKNAKKVHPKSKEKHSEPTKLNFELNLRAFVKIYSRGLTGPQKFTLILARMTEGKVSQTIKLEELERLWNRMAGLIGTNFNRAYANRAKDNGWVDTPKTGVYVLTNSWKQAIQNVSG